jgi:hypothetical protein
VELAAAILNLNAMRSAFAHCIGTVGLALAAASLYLDTSPALAANFVSARYEADTDELVVTLAYRGTHPDHEFSIEWGACKTDGAPGNMTLSARVTDREWNDLARRDFIKTVRFSLRDVHCRPSTITLFTPPQFSISVTIPARGGTDRRLRAPSTEAH